MSRCLNMLTAAALLMSSTAGIAAETGCLSADETRAEKVRLLQTQLMVGALKCRGGEDIGQRGHYNTFVRTYKPDLASTAKVLQGHFQRQHGTSHQRMLDEYITAMANQVSAESERDEWFCYHIGKLGGKISRERDSDILVYADAAPFADLAHTEGCRLTALFRRPTDVN